VVGPAHHWRLWALGCADVSDNLTLIGAIFDGNAAA
jgi:hypothetical protein